MLSRALFRHYLRTASIYAAVLILYTLISVSNDHYIYSGKWFVQVLPLWCFYALVCMYRMRTSEFYGFMNALPVTHRQQWLTIWFVNVLGIILTGVVTLVIYAVNFNEYYDLSYYVLPVVAEIVVTICLISAAMWLCTIKILTIGRMICYGFICGITLASYENLGKVASFMLNYKGNSFSYIVSNIFNLYRSPLREYRLEVNEAVSLGKTTAEITDSTYGITYILLTILLLAITCLLVYFGLKNHSRADLSKDIHDQMIYPKKSLIYVLTGIVITPIVLSIANTAIFCDEATFTSSDDQKYESVVLKGADGDTRSGICYEYFGSLYNYSSFDMDHDISYVVVFVVFTAIGTFITIVLGKLISNGIYGKEGYSSGTQNKSIN